MKSTDNSDQLFRAFADQTRLRVLALLSQRSELCVCAIVSALSLPQSKISRHLGYLRQAGLVVGRKEGLWVYYGLAKPAGHFHRGLIRCLKNCFEVELLKHDARKLKK